LNVQLTLDEKLLEKIKNAIRTGGKIQRQQAVYTRLTTHTLRYRRAVICAVPSGNLRGNYWGGDRRYRIIRVKESLKKIQVKRS
jgi:hypothetical protein